MRTTAPNVFYSLMKRIFTPESPKKSREWRKKTQKNNWKQFEDGSRPTFVPSLISEKAHDTGEKFSSNFNNLFASFRSNFHEYACACFYCVRKKDLNVETALRAHTYTERLTCTNFLNVPGSLRQFILSAFYHCVHNFWGFVVALY